MFDFLKPRKDQAPDDVKGVREGLLQFIKEQLRRAEGGEGGHIKGLSLFLAPTAEEKHVYEQAVYLEEENRFRDEEVQKIADDYALDLPNSWTMDIQFIEEIPAEAIRSEAMKAGLFILTRKQPSAIKTATAYVKVLQGEAEKEIYSISSSGGRVNIGREKKVQTADGFYRVNHIAFPAESGNGANRSVSRQHAHIEWSAESGAFLLFADEGGVPPRNKIKVRSAGNEPVKMQTTAIGHVLQEGDQLILGESALLEFSYSGEEN